MEHRAGNRPFELLVQVVVLPLKEALLFLLYLHLCTNHSDNYKLCKVMAHVQIL
jgi:hypothetical protein